MDGERNDHVCANQVLSQIGNKGLFRGKGIFDAGLQIWKRLTITRQHMTANPKFSSFIL